MKTCRHFQSQFVDELYRQLGADDLQAFEAHLNGCPKCRAAFQKIQRTGDLLSLKIPWEPEPDFWEKFEDQVLQQALPAPTTGQRLNWQFFFSGWRLQLAGGLGVLCLGIFLGYLFFGGHFFLPLAPETTVPPVSVVQTQALDYLDRSRILLLGMVNIDTDQMPGEVNFTHQKKISRELLQEAAELRPQLSHTENLQLQELIGKLEMILLQIANYEKQFDLPAISLISSGIENQSILLKINIEEMRLTNRLQQKQRQSVQDQKVKL